MLLATLAWLTGSALLVMHADRAWLQHRRSLFPCEQADFQEFEPMLISPRPTSFWLHGSGCESRLLFLESADFCFFFSLNENWGLFFRDFGENRKKRVSILVSEGRVHIDASFVEFFTFLKFPKRAKQ